MTHRHTIRRVTLEVGVAEAEEARRLQGVLGELFHRRLSGILDRYLTAAGGAGLDQLDRLELDLGRIDPAELEEQLAARLEALLPGALRRALHAARMTADTGGIAPAAAPALALIGQFARSGGLPSWSDARSRRQLEEAVESARRNAPAALAELVRGLARADRPLDRLVQHLDDTGLKALIAAVVAGGGRGGVDAAIPAELLGLLAETAAVAGIGRVRLRIVLWRETLRAVSLPTGADEAPAPWRRVLSAVAQDCGTTLALLVSDIAQALRRQREPVSATTLTVVADLAMRVPPPVPRRGPAGGLVGGISGGPEALGSLFDRLRHRADELAPLAELLRPLAARLPPDLHPSCAAALADLLGWDANRPGEAPPLAAVRALVRPFLQADLITGAAVDKALAGVERRVTADRLTAEQNRAEEETRAGSEAETAAGSEAGDADVLYLDNAGLCLLWPFLGHFFTHLGLMGEDRAFLDEPARHRAVFLLHHAATGAADAPEYQLALNKVLCGMALDILPGFGDPVTGAEVEETERLLGALTAHMAGLAGLSVEDLREGFLLRPGALSTRDGAWLLRVERRACDTALDPPPWPMEWIRLPWMAAPMRVEW